MGGCRGPNQVQHVGPVILQALEVAHTADAAGAKFVGNCGNFLMHLGSLRQLTILQLQEQLCWDGLQGAGNKGLGCW